MQIIAHRGYSARYPENTILAFEMALSAGATAIECDIQEVDGKFYVFHDWYLDRLTNGKGRLSSLNKDEVEQLQVKGAHAIPCISDLFSCITNQATLNLELKAINNVEAFANALNRELYKHDTRVVISSFEHELLSKIKSALRECRHRNNIRYAALIAHLPKSYAQYAIELEVDIAAIEAHLVNDRFIKHAHTYNLEVWCYTVNDDLLIQKLRDIKADAIFTDDPKWALACVKSA
ncbi:glycerophosphodiester phosphodiesterase [Agaribacter flavus]|uniref:Glycerophosphodiester phosphodiesterase n=1 Tax=Agaribacter flavus TaxID=1902781 RepID=A0ABV7FT49_9ALTE